MKFMIVVAVLSIVATACDCAKIPVCVDISIMHECVGSCGVDTILLTKDCSGAVDLYWTNCLIKCLGIRGIGPKPQSCVSLCELGEFLLTFDKC